MFYYQCGKGTTVCSSTRKMNEPITGGKQIYWTQDSNLTAYNTVLNPTCYGSLRLSSADESRRVYQIEKREKVSGSSAQEGIIHILEKQAGSWRIHRIIKQALLNWVWMVSVFWLCSHCCYQPQYSSLSPSYKKGIKCVWKQKRPQIAKETLRQKNRSGGIRLPDFRLYYKATVIKTVHYRQRNRNIDWQNKIESSEIKPYTSGQFIYNKGYKNIQWQKDGLLNK